MRRRKEDGREEYWRRVRAGEQGLTAIFFGMTFAHSDALFPPPELRASLAVEFEKQCRILCFGPIPTWDDVQARFEAIRDSL